MRRTPFFPPEVAENRLRIVLLGQERVRIEQHRGLAVYQEEQMTFCTDRGEVTLTGRGLRFQQYTADEAVVCGEITGITFQQRGESQ